MSNQYTIKAELLSAQLKSQIEEYCALSENNKASSLNLKGNEESSIQAAKSHELEQLQISKDNKNLRTEILKMFVLLIISNSLKIITFFCC